MSSQVAQPHASDRAGFYGEMVLGVATIAAPIVANSARGLRVRPIFRRILDCIDVAWKDGAQLVTGGELIKGPSSGRRSSPTTASASHERVRARTRQTGPAGIHHWQERDDGFLGREARSVCSQGVGRQHFL
jgi:hypothetical protein